MSPRARKYVLASLLGIVTIALDQWTKELARQSLRPLHLGHTKTIVKNFFDLRYSENSGVAFGMMQSLAGGRVILTVVAAVALLLVLYYLRRSDDRDRRMHVALGLVGGGAIGNLVDRIAFGRVTDFIVWHYYGLEWPAFNIADAALVVGVALMALDMVRTNRTRGPAIAATSSKNDAGVRDSSP